MKKFFFGIGVAILFAFQATNDNDLKKIQGEVSKYEDFYIFTDCKPVNDYDYVATIKCNTAQVTGLNLSEVTYEQLRDNLIDIAKRKMKKGKMGEGNAIIIHPGSQSGDLIKLKE